MSVAANPKWILSGVVEAPVERVWQALLDLDPYLGAEHKHRVASTNHPQHFTVVSGYARVQVDVDPQQHRLADQGEWWYRGVRSVAPHDLGSRVDYQVYNIAPPVSRWLVPMVTRGVEGQICARFSQLLQALGDRLHCAAYQINA